MKNMTFPLLILALMLMSSCAAKKYVDVSQNWHSTAKMEEIEIFVDTESIKTNGSFLVAREKKVFKSAASKVEYVNKIRDKYATLGKPEKADKWSDFSYCIYTSEYDCLNSRFKVLSVEDYDSQGVRIIRTTPNKKEEKWLQVNQETVGDYSFFFVCDYED